MNALKADFNVDIFVDQKLINKKDVIPINSQPKNKTIKLLLETNKTILATKIPKNNIKRSTKGSYLKYEKAYIKTKNAIEIVRNAKLNDI